MASCAALDGNVILPGDLPVAFLEPSQPFQHLVVALRAALAGQPRVQRPAALLLGAAELHVAARPTVVVHVGQIVEDDRRGRVEEAPLALSEGRLERLAVLPEQVGGAVQLAQRQRLGPFQAEQLEGRRGACKPS